MIDTVIAASFAAGFGSSMLLLRWVSYKFLDGQNPFSAPKWHKTSAVEPDRFDTHPKYTALLADSFAKDNEISSYRVALIHAEAALQDFAHDAKFFTKAKYDRPAWALFISGAGYSNRPYFWTTHQSFDNACTTRKMIQDTLDAKSNKDNKNIDQCLM